MIEKLVVANIGFSRQPCWRAETMKQFCMKIDLISQRRENVLFFALQHGGNDVTWKRSLVRIVFFFFHNQYVFVSISVLSLHCFFFRWNLISFSVSFWAKKLTLLFEMLATVWRRRRNMEQLKSHYFRCCARACVLRACLLRACLFCN